MMRIQVEADGVEDQVVDQDPQVVHSVAEGLVVVVPQATGRYRLMKVEALE